MAGVVRRLANPGFRFILTFCLIAAPLSIAFATGNSGVTYHGRVLKPDGSPLENAQALFQSTGTNTAKIIIDNALGGYQSDLEFRDAGTAKFLFGKDTDNSFFIYDNANSRNAVQINSGNVILSPAGGNVGIGTTSPVAPLQIVGSSMAGGTGEGTGTPGSFTIRGASSSGMNATGGDLNLQAGPGTGAAGSGNINFQTAPSNGAGTVGMDPVGSFNCGNCTTFTYSYTVGSNSNRLLMAYVSLNSTSLSVTSLTYNGTALTHLGAQGSPATVQIDVWYMINPPSGAHNLIVNYSGTNWAPVGVASFYNVDQTTPLATPVTYGSASASSSNLTVPSSSTNMVYRAYYDQNNCGAPTSSGTVGWTFSSGGPAAYWGFTTQAGATSVSVTQTCAAAGYTVQYAGSINAVSTSGSDTSATVMTIANSGYVGIGTTSPQGSLDVAMPGNGNVYFRDPSGVNGTIKFGVAGGATYIESGVTTGSGSAAPLYFTSMQAGSTWMTISATGSVGIGTTTPGYPLDVTGSIRTTQAVLNSSAVPTISACGTTPPAATAGSNNNSGQFTLGTGSPTACTVTFANAFPNNAFCTVTPASSYTGTYYISAQSKSAFTVTLGTGTSSVKFNYTCGGN